ncbi:hypothetical protein ILUMI_22002 [Ignelater luminosus]|uniref:Fcf2 pre-rRNA processing C-terminal domain-containing protein n=1 Tax=Ignelater luminosus TaxID=2038154 RepID=A0A8K0FXL4_IGNLU|nr:hypothetical protein ILUMI_22002 [Ignelater luminosus]
MNFVIDTTGDQGTATKSLLPNLSNTSIPQANNSIIYNSKAPKKLPTFNSLAQNDFTFTNKKVNEILKKSTVLAPGFEQLHTVPQYEVSEKRLQKQRRREREKTKGKKWYGLPATEMTEEIKHDLEVLQMRSVLDPKRFYKKNDLKVLPKYFQIGKVVDSPLDYYNNRLTRKERKKTLVDELLADVEFNKYNKRKYKEIIEERQKTHYKAWRQAKKLKKKNK